MGAYLHLLHFLHTPVLHTTPLYLCVSVMYKSIRYMWLCVCLTVPILYTVSVYLPVSESGLTKTTEAME